MAAVDNELYLLNRMGLAYLLFDAEEALVFANDAAYRTVPALISADGGEQPNSGPLRSDQIFRFAAFDTFDLSASKLKRDGNEPCFSLATLFAERVYTSFEGTLEVEQMLVDQENEHKQAFECQPSMQLQGDTQDLWRKATISNFCGPNERSFFYSMLLCAPEIQKTVPALRPPAVASSTDILERPPLNRTISDPPVLPTMLDDLLHGVTDNEPQDDLPLHFYKSAVESMPQILFTSQKDGLVSYLNPQWYSYTGWPIGEATRELWADVFHPADVEQAVNAYGASVRAGKDIQLQYRVRGADGSYRWMIARGRCIRNEDGNVIGFVCTLTDGQDLINARQEAIQARQYISTVLKASAVALVVVDTNRKITLFEGNVPALNSLGVDKTAMVDQHLESVWPDIECTQQVQMMLLAAVEQSSVDVPDRDFSASVGDAHLRYRLSPLYETDASNVLSGISIVCTDVTAMVNAELELRTSQEERTALVASENAAKEASRLKSVFVTSLSHEIRTPISGIIGISELLLADQALSTKQRSLVEKQLRAGEVLLSLVSMVLDIGKMEANKLEIEMQPFHISSLLDDLDIFASLAEAKNIYFRRDIVKGYNGPLIGDRLRLAQILSNFISNAIKFTSRGGITLRICQEDNGDECCLAFELVDTGVGIDKETLPHLFKPFHQASVSTARQYGGSGLGLTIAKSLTELMNGSVILESTPGVGTTVRLRIPLQKSTTRPQVPYNMTGFSESGIAVQMRRDPWKILIVEDNKLLQNVYAALVSKMGFRHVDVADDGQHALELIEVNTYDLVLMDCEMPRLSGPGAVAIIRQHPSRVVRELKIIALTANAVAGDEKRLLASGMDLYLSKPVRAVALEQAIVQCLSREIQA